MSKPLSCSTNHKSSLMLMEKPENGSIHEYGPPVIKSAHPCTVNKVTSLNETTKWFSPDSQWSNKPGTSQKKSKRTRSTGSKSKNPNSPSVQSNSKPRNRRYGKLEFVDDAAVCSSDDNKENIKPGKTDVAQPETPSSTWNCQKSKARFGGSSLRTNLI